MGRPTTMKLVHPSSTENASKFAVFFTLYQIFFLYKLHWIRLFNLSIIYFLLLFFLFFLYLFSITHIIIFQRIEKFEQCTEIERNVVTSGSLQEIGRETTTTLFTF